MAEKSRESRDQQIAQAARLLAGGDREALGELFDLTAPALVWFARSITRNLPDAEDCVQGVILTVAANPRRFARVERPWAYLLKMTRHAALRLVADRARKAARSYVPGDDPTTSRRSTVERLELNNHVWRAVHDLPAAQAEVVVLKIWEEMTFAEIAVITEQSLNTVASRYRYAMSKLTDLLHEFRDWKEDDHASRLA